MEYIPEEESNDEVESRFAAGQSSIPAPVHAPEQELPPHVPPTDPELPASNLLVKSFKLGQILTLAVPGVVTSALCAPAGGVIAGGMFGGAAVGWAGGALDASCRENEIRLVS
jgi:hypothetical protein